MRWGGEAALAQFPELVRAEAARRPRATVATALPEIEADFYYLPTRANIGEGAAVRSTRCRAGASGSEWSGLAPTLLTGCSSWPKPELYARRTHDAAALSEAARLTPTQLGVLQGFPRSCVWPRKTAAGRIIGNAVPVNVMTDVARAALATGELRDASGAARAQASWEAWDEGRALKEAGEAPPDAESEYDAASWERAAAALQKAVADAGKARGRGALEPAMPDWALKEPRHAQHPAVAEWREGCKERGIACLTAEQEEALGLGRRGVSADDGPPCLGPSDPCWQRALERIKAGTGLAKLAAPITGGPNKAWQAYEDSKAPADVVTDMK